MDPRQSAQDVLRCHLCETPVPPLYCKICNIHLCLVCVGEHLLDDTTEHKVVPFKTRGMITKCKKHSSKICELYCEHCDIPICSLCIASKEHQTHNVDDIMNGLENKMTVLHQDLQELEKSLFPKYQEIASNVSNQKADLIKHSEKMTTAIDKHGDNLHKEIDNIIKKLKSGLDETNSKYLALLRKQEDQIAQTISEITQSIADLKKLRDSSDVSLVSSYKSRNAELRRLPPKLKFSLPSFTPREIKKEQLYKQFGSFSNFSMNTKETDYKIDSLGAKCSLLDRTFNDVPRIVTEIITEYEYLFSVSFLQNDQIWVYGKDNKIRLYNIQGELMESFQIESWPKGIAVTSNGGIVYTDDTLNITNKKYQLEGALSLVDWIHCSVCNTFSGDLLVVMVSNDIFQQSKVVRYDYGLSETQCIQYDDEGDYLYSSGGCPKHISENRNLDICVSDYGAHAVVVVNQAGELRFTYTGPPSITKVPFYPFGITTDSQSRILTSDYCNHRIHIIDQYGQFLRYIDNCDLKNPGGLCVDNRDNLFVVECTRSKVKKIQYYT